MSLLVPPAIIPTYTLPPAGPVATSLTIGQSIKDLPTESDTQMKRKFNVDLVSAQVAFNAQEARYQTDFRAANEKAQEAQNGIDSARLKKIASITLLAVSIIAAVGVVAATVVTGTLPLLLIGVPFALAAIPTGYYSFLFSKKVSQLNDTIEAPQKMPKPTFQLPVYNQKRDLELQQSRLDAQNELASVGTLQDVARADWQQDAIANFALFDKLTDPNNRAKREAFYAKSFQLLGAQTQIAGERTGLVNRAEEARNRLQREFKEWKSQQEREIASHEWAIDQQKAANQKLDQVRRQNLHLRPTAAIITSPITIMQEMELENKKRTVFQTIGRREAEINGWYQTTSDTIQRAFREAQQNLEEQYIAAKTAAR